MLSRTTLAMSVMTLTVRCALVGMCIGVLLITAEPVWPIIFTTSARKCRPQALRPMCVQCGLFNYSPIHLFVFGPPAAARTQEKYF